MMTPVMPALLNYVKQLGFPKAELKCDQEPSTVDVMNKLIERCKSTQLVPTASPKGSKGSLGRGERGRVAGERRAKPLGSAPRGASPTSCRQKREICHARSACRAACQPEIRTHCEQASESMCECAMGEVRCANAVHVKLDQWTHTLRRMKAPVKDMRDEAERNERDGRGRLV